ncbi:hypothetical protein ABE612_08835 [Achromobacter xylosoxidans]|uniref:hypothetical protein n=1 Tax=Betaproteobacteria TaxID=28216 RepID=UPI0021D9459A|nr:hypothetical protein [Pseudomonas aeruginosa]MCU9410216.1 hypothetical protein [Pseudomonas aeruginosa]
MALSEDQIQYLNSHPPGEAVARALSELLDNDQDLLGVDANERSITFRFALYLQQHFPDLTVDCEYNRDGIEPKRLGHLELYPDSEDDDAKTVFPDVIVHQRGTRKNHLVLEFKKSTSHVDRQIDLRKLRGYKQQLGYEHALFVEVGTEGKAIITALEWA